MQKKKDNELGLSKIDITKPHLVVLNEDPQLTHKLKYSLAKMPVHVGRKHGNPPPEITLSGIGIKINHALFEELGTEVLLLPNDENAKDFIFINGRQMENDDGEILTHMDKITFGTNTVLLFMKQSDGTDLYSVDWETAQIELQKEVENNLKKNEEHNEKKRQNELEELKKEMEEKHQKEKMELEEKMKKEIENLKSNRERDTQEQAKALEIKQNDIDKLLRKKMKDLETQKAKQKREVELKEATTTLQKTNEVTHKSSQLEQNLQYILRKLHKMKIITTETRRNVNLEVVLLKDICEYLGERNISNTNILIRVFLNH